MGPKKTSQLAKASAWLFNALDPNTKVIVVKDIKIAKSKKQMWIMFKLGFIIGLLTMIKKKVNDLITEARRGKYGRRKNDKYWRRAG